MTEVHVYQVTDSFALAASQALLGVNVQFPVNKRVSLCCI